MLTNDEIYRRLVALWEAMTEGDQTLGRFNFYAKKPVDVTQPADLEYSNYVYTKNGVYVFSSIENGEETIQLESEDFDAIEYEAAYTMACNLVFFVLRSKELRKKHKVRKYNPRRGLVTLQIYWGVVLSLLSQTNDEIYNRAKAKSEESLSGQAKSPHPSKADETEANGEEDLSGQANSLYPNKTDEAEDLKGDMLTAEEIYRRIIGLWEAMTEGDPALGRFAFYAEKPVEGRHAADGCDTYYVYKRNGVYVFSLMWSNNISILFESDDFNAIEYEVALSMTGELVSRIVKNRKSRKKYNLQDRKKYNPRTGSIYLRTYWDLKLMLLSRTNDEIYNRAKVRCEEDIRTSDCDYVYI